MRHAPFRNSIYFMQPIGPGYLGYLLYPGCLVGGGRTDGSSYIYKEAKRPFFGVEQLLAATYGRLEPVIIISSTPSRVEKNCQEGYSAIYL